MGSGATHAERSAQDTHRSLAVNESMIRHPQICDHRGGRFGMVTHRWWGIRVARRRAKMHISVNLRSAAMKSVAGRGRWFQTSSKTPLRSTTVPMPAGTTWRATLKMNSSQVPSRGRPIKFTPGRIYQITNFVERGKSPEEIAELIEVTINSLQVNCSRLGISLRRPKLDNGIRLLPPGKPVPSNGRTTPDLSCDVSVPLQPITERRLYFDSQVAGANPVHNTAPSRGRKRKRLISRTSPSRCVTRVRSERPS